MSNAPVPETRGSTLLLFTQSYPFETSLEWNFIEPQLAPLRDSFEHVIVIPSEGAGASATMPAGITSEARLAAHLRSYSARPLLAARALGSRLLWREIADQPWILMNLRGLRRLLRTAGRAELVRSWLTRYLASRGLEPRHCVGYTFWCDDVATGLAIVKSEIPTLTAVSRAHGADLYAERHRPPYLPCRTFTLTHLNGLFPDSGVGLRYVAEHYPWFGSRCEVARMGVRAQGFVASVSASGQWSIVSCSLLVPVKRVDLILRAIDSVARQRPAVQFEWHHFGDGDLRPQIEKLARTTLPPNVTARLPGYEGLSALMQFYRDHPVDVFVNASTSEGTPVAVMEAISCGIPVVATAVGGNPEIVGNENGVLVSPNPSPDELADAMLRLLDDPELAAAKRQGSRKVWDTKYNAETNYREFARRLVELRGNP